MLDAVCGPFEIGYHVKRNTVEGGNLRLLELARGDELRILRRNRNTFVDHTALQQQRLAVIVQSDRLGYQVFFQTPVGLGLERRGILKTPDMLSPD